MPPDHEPPPPLRLAIDRAALAHNWRALDALSGSASAGAAVKANAYGVGVHVAIPVLAAAGCRDFFVAHWCEAAEIIEMVDPASVAVLHGPLDGRDVAWARAHGVRPVINSLAQAARWLDGGGGACDLMVDTGMHRLGLPLAELGDPLVARLDVAVLMSHLASAEEDSPLNDLQRIRWEAARRTLPHARASLANSAGIALGPAWHGDLTRPGLALYGGVPCAALAPHIRQVVTPEAAILQVRDVGTGDTLGYSATFTAPGPMRVGVIALGYADGYLQCWSDKGSVHAAGQNLPVLGRVSMDMTIVDLTTAPELGEGDWLKINYDLPCAATASGLSQYELLTLLGKRFAR